MTSPGQWRMFSRCSPGAEDDRLEQINLAWADECRNWIHGRPPKLEVRRRKPLHRNSAAVGQGRRAAA